jgi:hypothetical protein
MIVKTFVKTHLMPFVLMEYAVVTRGVLKESTIHPEAQSCKDGDCTTFAVQTAKSIIV